MFLHPYLQKQIDLDIEKHAEPKNMATSSQKGNHLYVDGHILHAAYGM